RSTGTLECLPLVGSDINLPAAVDTRVPRIVRAAVDGRAAPAVSHAAAETRAAAMDGRGIGSDVKVRRVRTQLDEARIFIRRFLVLASFHLVSGIRGIG